MNEQDKKIWDDVAKQADEDRYADNKSASALCYAELWFTGDYWEINIKRDEDDVQVEFYTADDFSELLRTLEKLNDKLRAAQRKS